MLFGSRNLNFCTLKDCIHCHIQPSQRVATWRSRTNNNKIFILMFHSTKQTIYYFIYNYLNSNYKFLLIIRHILLSLLLLKFIETI